MGLGTWENGVLGQGISGPSYERLGTAMSWHGLEHHLEHSHMALVPYGCRPLSSGALGSAQEAGQRRPAVFILFPAAGFLFSDFFLVFHISQLSVNHYGPASNRANQQHSSESSVSAATALYQFGLFVVERWLALVRKAAFTST